MTDSHSTKTASRYAPTPLMLRHHTHAHCSSTHGHTRHQDQKHDRDRQHHMSQCNYALQERPQQHCAGGNYLVSATSCRLLGAECCADAGIHRQAHHFVSTWQRHGINATKNKRAQRTAPCDHIITGSTHSVITTLLDDSTTWS